MVADGWGGNIKNIKTHEVEVMAKVWAQYRKEQQPYFDQTFRMRSGASAPRDLAFKQVAFNPNASCDSSGCTGPWPDRVLVERIPLSGRTAASSSSPRAPRSSTTMAVRITAGLVAYTQQTLRLWAPTSANGYIIFVRDG